MTPLAYSIVKQRWLPVRERTLFDQVSLLDRMADVHCFDVSEVWEIANQLGKRWWDEMCEDGKLATNYMPVEGTLAFLPAPRTWLEWTTESPGDRIGVLLEEAGELALCAIAAKTGDHFYSVDEFVFPLRSSACQKFEMRLNPKAQMSHASQMTLILMMYGFLAMINSPKVIGRRQHMPHRALQKMALKGFAGGRFPLHAWTEVKLHVGKPAEIDNGGVHEAHLTGRRALHFCRAHIRIRLGRLEYVTSHWRGDPSIGIKQTRYRAVV